MLRNKQGQNTLEYVILFTGVVLIAATFLGRGGLFNERFRQALDDSSAPMTTVAGRAATMIKTSDEGEDPRWPR